MNRPTEPTANKAIDLLDRVRQCCMQLGHENIELKMSIADHKTHIEKCAIAMANIVNLIDDQCPRDDIAVQQALADCRGLIMDSTD